MTTETNGHFGRTVLVDDLPVGGQIVDLRPSADDCGAIAERVKLLGLSDFSLTGRLSRFGKSEARFEGQLDAKVVQSCIVTLEPVQQAVSELKRD